jgi:hypothetical protein
MVTVVPARLWPWCGTASLPCHGDAASLVSTQVLQSALEVVALHGGALDLLCAVLQGGHYTLTLRAQPSMAEAAAKSWSK